MRVDSSATTGRPSARAAATSGATSSRSRDRPRARRSVRRAITPRHPGGSSERGLRRWRAADRWPAIVARWSASAPTWPLARAPSQPAMNPASNASPAPVVSSAATASWRCRSGAAARLGLRRGRSRANTRAPRGPRLITATLGVLEEPLGRRAGRGAPPPRPPWRTRGPAGGWPRAPAPRDGRGSGAGRPTRGPRRPSRALAPRDRVSSTARTRRRTERLDEQRVGRQVDAARSRRTTPA